MIYLCYNNLAHQDGAGSQIQRQISLWMIAKHFDIGYIHNPILSMCYQGLQAFKNNSSDDALAKKYNELFKLENIKYDNTVNIDSCIVVSYITTDIIFNTLQKSMVEEKNILIAATYGQDIIDKSPNLLLSNKPKFDFMKPKSSGILNIAVHVRRGEIRVVDTDRLLPKEYYINSIKNLSKILNENNINHVFNIYGEALDKEIIVTPTHHGIVNRISNNIRLEPDIDFFDDFKALPNTKLFINTDQVETFKELINADCFIASRSSFSYVAAILNRNEFVFFPKFWHGLSPRWFNNSNTDDILRNKDEIIRKIQELTY